MGGICFNLYTILFGTSLNIRWGGGQHVMKKWTQQDLRLCKNDGSKRSNNNVKGGQQDRKSRRKLVQIASKVSNDSFCEKINNI